MLTRILEPEVMDSIEDAAEYDGMDHSVVNQLFVDDLLTVLRASAGNTSANSNLKILDLGAGTLQIPLRLLHTWPDCGPVLACDLSFQMLKLGRRHLQDAGLCDRILPLLCDAKQLPVEDGSIDVIMSNSIIHHIPDPADVFHEIHRCIRPGGLVFVRDLLRPETERQLDELVRTCAGDETEYARKLFRDSLHAALSLEEMQEILTHTGFDPHSVRQTSDRHWTVALWMPGQ